MANAFAEAGSNVTVVVDFLDNSDTGPGGGHIVPLVGATGVGKVIATAMQTLAGGRRRAVATVSSEAFAGFGADATFFVAGARGISNDGLAAADSTQNATVTFVKRPALTSAPPVDAAVAFPGVRPVYFEVSAQSHEGSRTGFGAPNFTGANTGIAEAGRSRPHDPDRVAVNATSGSGPAGLGEAGKGAIDTDAGGRGTVVTAKVETAALRGAAGEAAADGYTYVLEGLLGEGIHGSVQRATCVETGAKVAIKKVRQDPHGQDTELRNVLEVGGHPNIVRLHQHYFSSHPQGLYLNLVFEYVPTSLEPVSLQRPNTQGELPLGVQRPGPLPPLPTLYVKIYLHQTLAALAHLHRQGIAHRDLDSSQIMVDPTSHVVRLVDLGAAEDLAPDGKRILALAEVGALEYQAPELIFAPEVYWYFTPAIDMWSVGCVMADLLLGRRKKGRGLFNYEIYNDGSRSTALAIFEVLGRPSKQDLRDMEGKGQAAAWRQHFQRFSPFVVKGKKEAPLAEVFRGCPAADAVALDLLERLLVYSPRRRLTAAQALEHPFFDTLRGLEALPDGTPMPPLVGFATDRPEAAAKQ